MKKLLYCVYVLFSLKDKLFYIGYTTNLHARRPFTLLFCEYYLSIHDATRREKYLKTTAGKKTLRLMLKDSLLLVGK